MPKFFVFARGAMLFFVISHIASYFFSTLQCAFIVKEIRKNGGR